MELDVQTELSNKQEPRGASTKSTNIIDLGGLHYVSGYPVDVTATRGDGRIQIAHRLGTKDMPFYCVITEGFTGATDLTVQFRVTNVTPNATGSNIGATSGTLVASQIMPDLAPGTQIPWPAIPRYLTGRYFFLNYAIAGTATTGMISAGFTTGMPSEL